MIAATYHLQQLCVQKPDLIIQAGIAGTYNDRLQIGQTVLIESEVMDTGAENDDELLSIFDLNLADPDEFPYVNGALPCYFLNKKSFGLQQVRGLTVNCSSGNEQTIDRRKLKYKADIESMEGAALHYTALMSGIPFLQVRTISNVVEKRNREHWNIPLALQNNALEIYKLLQTI
jgi:futalosine hydrolase